LKHNKLTSNDEIIIRAAKPQFEEGLIYARLFDETAEGFFKSMLGVDAYRIIADAYVKSNNEYSFENIAFAEYRNIIVGMVSGYTTSEKQSFRKKILKNKSTLSFSVVSRFLSRFLGPKVKGDYYLQAIIVDEKMRGKGVGESLINCIEDKAIEKAAIILSLDVSNKNDKAMALYKRQGMTVDSHWPNLPLIPHIFTRFTKNL
jgi:ribosomal protein S18 acetylase RimI-like enzyme